MDIFKVYNLTRFDVVQHLTFRYRAINCHSLQDAGENWCQRLWEDSNRVLNVRQSNTGENDKGTEGKH